MSPHFFYTVPFVVLQREEKLNKQHGNFATYKQSQGLEDPYIKRPVLKLDL